MDCLRQFSATSTCPDLSLSPEMKRKWERVREKVSEQEEWEVKDSCAWHSHVCVFRGGTLNFYVRLWWDRVGMLLAHHCQVEAKKRFQVFNWGQMLKGLKDNVRWKSWQFMLNALSIFTPLKTWHDVIPSDLGPESSWPNLSPEEDVA